ncbi:hypothetical protein F0726_00083 [Acidithiobacillus caldus]|jgi:hypothetical protein|nr:hypothetical protein F0726_00083 [Acidithiobacillus caldus]
MLWGNKKNEDGENLPIAPIEEKVRAWQKKTIASDIARLSHVLQGNAASSLDFFMLAL